MNDAHALGRCVTCLLENASPDGYWGDFQSEWDPVITATTCNLLLSCGMSGDAPWHVERNGFVRCCLDGCFRWLNHAIRPDGTFGTDFWDAAQCGILIEQFSLVRRFSAYDSLKKYLMTAINSRSFKEEESQWNGPGFMATAIDYLIATRSGHDLDTLAAELVALQMPAGCWQGALDSGGAPIIPPVWHTAQAVIALSNANLHSGASNSTRLTQSVTKGLAWLAETQDASGAWLAVQQYRIYATAYAVLALLCDRPKYELSLRKGIEYLKSKIGPDGKCSDLAGTLMCALALSGTVHKDFQTDLSFMDFLLSRQNLIRAEAMAAELKNAQAKVEQQQVLLQSYEKKYGDADIVLTKKQMFVFTLVALLFTVFGTVAGVYALNAFIRHAEEPPRATIESIQHPDADTPSNIPTAVQPKDQPTGAPAGTLTPHHLSSRQPSGKHKAQNNGSNQ